MPTEDAMAFAKRYHGIFLIWYFPERRSSLGQKEKGFRSWTAGGTIVWNPLPIRQSAWSLARGWWEGGLGSVGPSFHGGRNPSTYRAIALPGVGDLQARFNSHSRVQTRYRSRSLFSHPPPWGLYSALIVILGYIGGNDPKRQGQRHSPMPPTVDLRKKCGRRMVLLGWCLVFRFLCILWVFHSLVLLAKMLMYSLGFAKLVRNYGTVIQY